MKTPTTIALILFGLHVWASPDGDLIERMVRYRDMSPWERAFETYRMPESQRQELLAIFRDAYERDSVPDEGLERILISLRDERVRQKYVDGFLEEPNSILLGYTRDPEVLHGVAKHLKLDDWPTPRMADFDISWGQPWDSARETVLEILRNAPEFNEDVINWARRLDDERHEEERAILREWWQANERFFAEKNYKAVRPGRDMPQLADESLPPKRIEESAVSTSASEATEMRPSRELANHQQDTTPSAWLIWAAGSAVLAFVLIVIRRRVALRARR